MRFNTERVMGVRPPVSVCMATYNGAAYVTRQVQSILADLEENDELVIYDDSSTDSTVAKVIGINDLRIRLLRGSSNIGHVRAFETAINAATGDIVLLSDQDDVWAGGRVGVFISALEQAPVAASSLRFEDLEGRDLGGIDLVEMSRRPPAGVVAALLLGRLPYFGCAMGFNARVRSTLMPFPAFVEAHDHWLAVVGARCGGVAQISSATVIRTLHGSNLTPVRRRSLARVITTRFVMVAMVWAAAVRHAPVTRASRSGQPE